MTSSNPARFRTDFAGRSLTQSATAIDDYADTAGKRRKENDTAHGTQPGDPAKAAQAIIAAVEADEPAVLAASRQRRSDHLPTSRANPP